MLHQKFSLLGRSTGTLPALLALGATAAMYGASTLHAQSLPQYGLFNTGIDPTAMLVNGVPAEEDTHYAVSLEASAGSTPLASPATFVTAQGLPYTPSDDATSSFISPQPSYANHQIDQGGYYDFTTTFDLTGVTNLSAVSIFGRFETDDILDNISLNGTPLFTGPLLDFTVPGYKAFSGYYNLADTALLVGGVNTLTFRVFNYANSDTDPVALRTEFSAVPEPSTWAAVGVLSALTGIGGWLRRRRATV